MNKRQVKTFFAVIVIVLSVFGIIFSDSSSKFSSPFKAPVPAVTEEAEEETFGEVQGSYDSEEPEGLASLDKASYDNAEINEGAEDSANEEDKGYKVIKVVDGDTIDINIEGKTERLRLIGIDTPETVDPRKSVQCFGREASGKAKELLGSQFVILESDESQGERDKYKRLLRYVFLPDGTNFNLFMIAEGYAHEYTYDEPYKYQAEFKQAEIDARNQNKGLWSPSTCSGNK
ncbi:MAG: thermonuclease family protein [Candidatus Levybacteria bacterium]|nr:thermonuclease family protein [Candidatus Levybacteria bacterium]